jgi:hypothetical protein
MAFRAATAVIVLLILIAVGFFAFSLFGNPIQKPSYSLTDPNNSIYTALRQSNESFSEGSRLMQSGKYGDSIEKFEQALSKTSDPAEEALVKMHLAVAKEKNNLFADYVQAVPILKDIISNQKYPAISRAYAIQELGLMSVVFADPRLDDEIFADAPFKELRVDGDAELSQRKLFEYAAEIYPLGASEAQVARWYSSALMKSYLEKAADKKLPQDTVDKYKEEIRTRLHAADADFDRIKDGSEQSYAAQILSLMAFSVGRMQVMGDTSFGDMTPLYVQALQSYKVTNSQPYMDGFTRFNFAQLSNRLKQGKDSAGIASILEPFYATNVYANSPIERFFKNSHANTASPDYANIAGLGKVDPKFAAYLKNLGWKDSDFK